MTPDVARTSKHGQSFEFPKGLRASTQASISLCVLMVQVDDRMANAKSVVSDVLKQSISKVEENELALHRQFTENSGSGNI